MNAAIVSTIDTVFRAVEKQFGTRLDARIVREELPLIVVFNDSESIGFTVKRFTMVQECIARCFYELGFFYNNRGYCEPNIKWFWWAFATGLNVCPGTGFDIGETELQQTVQHAIDGYIAASRRELTAEYARLSNEIAEREERRNEIVAMLGNL